LGAVAAAAGQRESLYPSATAAEIDDLLAVASNIDSYAAAWMQPTCASATPDDREAARKALTDVLHGLDSRIDDSNHLVRQNKIK